jgi:hypothetical protein
LVTEEQREEILKRNRLPAKFIADQLGLKTAQVQRVLKREARSSDSVTPFPPELISKVIKLALEKVSVRDIAYRLDTKRSKVSQVLSEWMPIEKRQFERRRGVRLSDTVKRALRRERRVFIQALSKRTSITERTLNEVLFVRRVHDDCRTECVRGSR